MWQQNRVTPLHLLLWSFSASTKSDRPSSQFCSFQRHQAAFLRTLPALCTGGQIRLENMERTACAAAGVGLEGAFKQGVVTRSGSALANNCQNANIVLQLRSSVGSESERVCILLPRRDCESVEPILLSTGIRHTQLFFILVFCSKFEPPGLESPTLPTDGLEACVRVTYDGSTLWHFQGTCSADAAGRMLLVRRWVKLGLCIQGTPSFRNAIK